MASRSSLIRMDLLTYLYAAQPVPRTVEAFLKGNRRDGQVSDASPNEALAAANYWLTNNPPLISARERPDDAATKEYSITADGVRLLEREGLV